MSDPFGIFMAGFTLKRAPAETRAIAEAQRALATLDGDNDGAAWWDRVMAYLTITGR